MAFEADYRPRDPQQNPVYGVVAGHLETFLARQRERQRNVPAFVEREFRSFLDCGVLCRGFIRVHCDGCGLDRLVPFSCKKRAVCNSCGGRRMSDTAAHLVDRVFPHLPVRQWVLSLPYALRYRLAYDARLVRGVLNIFTKTVFAFLIRRARDFGAVQKPQCGAVTFIQRFDSALRLNLHFHMLTFDGIYAADEDGHPRFQVLLAPDNEEIAQITASLAEAIPKVLQRRGLGPDRGPEESDPLWRDQPWLAGLYAASVLGRTAFAPNAGRRLTRAGDQIDPESLAAPHTPRCATTSGFSVHANVAVHAEDRPRLERLARYCARPPIAMERLEPLTDGRLLYRFKRPWRDGTTHIVMEPLELLERLSAIVPAPKTHLVRYAGVLAPSAKWRAFVVPARAGAGQHGGIPQYAISPRPLDVVQPTSVGEHPNDGGSVSPESAPSRFTPHGRNYTWAELMKRVWFFDVFECPRCHHQMRILAAIHPPEATARILKCLGLPSRAPPLARARQTGIESELL